MNLKSLETIPPWDWPENVKEIVTAKLVDRRADPDERLLAARLAGDTVLIDDEVVTLLLERLDDASESDDLRGQAAVALGAVLELSDIDGFDDPDDVPITESTFINVVTALRKLYADADVPNDVRRRVLEASVRAPRDWHKDAVRSAYYSGDAQWMLTAVFAMEWIRGFDDEILEALNSDDEHIHYEAVCAAGANELDAAWPHIAELITSEYVDKDILLAAIAAAPSIRPREAGPLLSDLADSDDEDIAEAAEESIFMAGLISKADFDGLNGEDALW